MTTAIIHLSDFHNVKGKYENHPVVVSSLFADLRKQIDQLEADDVFLAFTGDVAQSGDETDQYVDFKEAFHDRLCEIGIPKNRRIFVPGNHDLSRLQVVEDFVIHEAVVSQDLNEKAFNDFVLKAPNILTAKFKNYSAFQQDFCDFGIAEDKVTGAGWDLTDSIGVYCLNTALCSSGGLERDGRVLSDRRRLRIDTRSLHQWLQASKSKWKILLMHHPLHWLAESSEKELKVLLRNHFALRLYGHEHEQDALHSIDDGKSLLECCSPALFSRKSDQLGYAIVTVDKDLGPREISYRQWTKQHVFVSGTAFSGTDNGKVNFHKNLFQQMQPATVGGEDAVLRYLTRRLDKALISFSGQPKVWVDPIVKKTPEVNTDAASTEAFDFNELLRRPVPTLIHALPQFGLTCLAHHLVKRAWEGNGHLWLYLDSVELKATSHAVREAVALELSELGLTHSEIKCVVLDSIGSSVKDAWKILSKVTANFSGIPVICMHTLDPTIFSGEASGSPDIPTDFQNLYVWTLPRNLIREIVADYNDSRHVGDENQVIKRLVADLEMLNLHRTPLNCLTLLKVSELDFDESPVNRSEVIKRVLFLLFNVDSLPSYKARPDLKDCEYVIGYFCETMLKTGSYTFSRTHFLNVLQQCCRERFIELEIHVVFDVLSANNILVVRDGQFAFKFAFWIYYFAALRMHHDQNFANFMLSDRRYAKHPELIEFYTGIDRQREDALNVLKADLERCRSEVEQKCGLPKNMDIYSLAQWNPSPGALEQMTTEIEEGVRDSNLPSEIKDRFADQGYDLARPYNQGVNILSDHSLIYLMQTLRAASKALRNSDYVDPSAKRALLEEIMRCWEQLSIVLLVVLPVLADKGEAFFDGANFVLEGDFGPTASQRVMGILAEIPGNVIRWSRDDLLSQKMGPLLIDVFNQEQGSLRKHELALLLILQRPRGWAAAIQAYISATQKNSFFLLNIYRSLRTEYRFSYVSNATLKEIVHLIRMAITKHVTGAKEPGVDLIEKTMPRIGGDPVLPPREVP